ncbi:MAG: PKD domain-containing protein [Bacteroidota bacterium]|nr:PKD domain-containing protein [Bacteroidota bacterium]
MKTQVLVLILLVGILAFTACQKEEENTIPTPALIVEPNQGSISTIFVFDATNSYDDQDPASILEVRWDWNGDGRWDTEWSTNKVENYQFDHCCIHVVKMEIRDSEGWSNITKSDINVFQDSISPKASFIVKPISGGITTIFKFDASSSTNNVYASGHLNFRWDWDSDGTWDSDYTSDNLGYHKYHTEGIYDVTLEVRNSLMLTDIKTRQVVVTP